MLMGMLRRTSTFENQALYGTRASQQKIMDINKERVTHTGAIPCKAIEQPDIRKEVAEACEECRGQHDHHERQGDTFVLCGLQIHRADNRWEGGREKGIVIDDGVVRSNVEAQEPWPSSQHSYK